jgi:putative Holliday junction resolvase
MIFENILNFDGSISKKTALMGLDLGSKTIGVAISDSFRSIATPLKTIRRTKFSEEVKVLFQLISEREISGIIIGLPKNMDGTEGARCQSTRAFARNIITFRDFPISYWDERLSTVAAEKALLEADINRKRRSEVIDHVAASYILQGALDRLSHNIKMN